MSGRRGASRGCAGAVQLQRRGPPYLRRLDPGQSDAAVAERRSEPTGPDPRERPSCEEVRWLNGTRRVGDVVSARPPTRGRQSPALRSGRGVSLRRLPDPARPGPRLSRPGVLSCAALASRLPAFPRPQLPLSLSLPPFAPSRLFPPCESHSSPLASRGFCAAASLPPPLGVRGWPGRAG